ncbi:MAG: hypothetical protein OXG04_28840 [Acidobacteria bacterium]|nr:hypothetical protein [Acidobacteriota bacterium]
MRGTAAWRVTLFGLLLLVIGPRPGAADDVQSWTEVKLRVLASDRVDWRVGGIARIRDSLGIVYDRRLRTDVGFRLGDAASMTLGYILLNRTRTEVGANYGRDHRLHAAWTYRINAARVRIESKTLYERHVGRRDSGDFNRYRQQIEIERLSTHMSPWVHQSVAFERQGFVRSRSRVGVLWRLGLGRALIVAYQFERRKPGAAWRSRHAVLSEWSLDLVARAILR